MEQAVNTVTKGLLLDPHPIVLGNDVLSDCLNGTIITMEGHEAVLLNDMGNRRIDEAYLPKGYIPVGIKEYGGVIYIAAYNPITNRSLIGSFPSPERTIDSTNDNNLTLNVDFDIPIDNIDIKDLLKLDKEYGNHRFLKQDSIIKTFSTKTLLHAGDKFALTTTNLASLFSELAGRVEDPHNWAVPSTLTEESIVFVPESMTVNVKVSFEGLWSPNTNDIIALFSVNTGDCVGVSHIQSGGTASITVWSDGSTDKKYIFKYFDSRNNRIIFLDPPTMNFVGNGATIDDLNLIGSSYLNLNRKFDPNSYDYYVSSEGSYISNFFNTIMKSDSSYLEKSLGEEEFKYANYNKYGEALLEKNKNIPYIITPKNNLFTLNVGVLNSQNLFVDITPNLMRWDSEGLEISTDGYSEEYANNVGYFILNTSENSENPLSIDTAQLLDKRNTLIANTYSNKITGPLSIKTTINHFQNISYNLNINYIKPELIIDIKSPFSTSTNNDINKYFNLNGNAGAPSNATQNKEFSSSTSAIFIYTDSLDTFTLKKKNIDDNNWNNFNLSLIEEGLYKGFVENNERIQFLAVNPTGISLHGIERIIIIGEVIENLDDARPLDVIGNISRPAYYEKQITPEDLYFDTKTIVSEKNFDAYDLFINGSIQEEYGINPSDKINILYNKENNLYKCTFCRTYKYDIPLEEIRTGEIKNLDIVLVGKLLNNNGVSYENKTNQYYLNFNVFEEPPIGSIYINIEATVTYNSPDLNPTCKYIADPYFNLHKNDENRSPIYLKNICFFDTIEPSKIGTGYFEINNWRFINTLSNDNTSLSNSTLYFNLISYPKSSETYSNLTLTFTNVNSADNETPITISGLEVSSGRKEINLKSLNNLSLNPRKIYKVTISYDKEEDEVTENVVYDNKKYWVMTTELFNNSNSVTSLDFIDDFCNPSNLEYLNRWKRIFMFKVTTTNVDLTKGLVEGVSSNWEGDFFREKSEGNDDTKLSFKKLFKLKITLNNIETSTNIKNYPDFLELDSLEYGIPTVNPYNEDVIVSAKVTLDGNNKKLYTLETTIELYIKGKYKLINSILPSGRILNYIEVSKPFIPFVCEDYRNYDMGLVFRDPDNSVTIGGSAPANDKEVDVYMYNGDYEKKIGTLKGAYGKTRQIANTTLTDQNGNFYNKDYKLDIDRAIFANFNAHGGKMSFCYGDYYTLILLENESHIAHGLPEVFYNDLINDINPNLALDTYKVYPEMNRQTKISGTNVNLKDEYENHFGIRRRPLWVRVCVNGDINNPYWACIGYKVNSRDSLSNGYQADKTGVSEILRLSELFRSDFDLSDVYIYRGDLINENYVPVYDTYYIPDITSESNFYSPSRATSESGSIYTSTELNLSKINFKFTPKVKTNKLVKVEKFSNISDLWGSNIIEATASQTVSYDYDMGQDFDKIIELLKIFYGIMTFEQNVEKVGPLGQESYTNYLMIEGATPDNGYWGESLKKVFLDHSNIDFSCLRHFNGNKCTPILNSQYFYGAELYSKESKTSIKIVYLEGFPLIYFDLYKSKSYKYVDSEALLLLHANPWTTQKTKPLFSLLNRYSSDDTMEYNIGYLPPSLGDIVNTYSKE